MERMKRTVSKENEELKERAKELGLNISVENIKTVIQNIRRRIISEIVTIKGYDMKLFRVLNSLGLDGIEKFIIYTKI
jgi:hypothetical protein